MFTMYVCADRFVSVISLGFIKGLEDEIYWIYFILKIFLCFQIISYDLENSDSQKYVLMLVAW